jgi:hypothetical protein
MPFPLAAVLSVTTDTLLVPLDEVRALVAHATGRATSDMNVHLRAPGLAAKLLARCPQLQGLRADTAHAESFLDCKDAVDRLIRAGAPTWVEVPRFE